jgi:LysM repeat protein
MPQGSLPEQTQRKSQVRIIVFSILAIHVVLLGALLIQGCKRDEQPPLQPVPLPPPDTNIVIPPPPMTNIPTPPMTNLPTPPSTNILETGTDTAKEHAIAQGETLGALAAKYKVPVQAIIKANPGVDPTRLKIGQKIVIPPKPPTPPVPPKKTSATAPGGPEVGPGESVYTVKAGDNLYNIAKANGVSVKSLQSANNLKTSRLMPGQKLKLPAKAPAASAPATSASRLGAAPVGPPMASPVTATGPTASGL